MRNTLKTRVLLGAGALLVIVGVVFGVLLIQIRLQDQFEEEVRAADETINQANLVVKLTLDLETGQRGFLLTGDREFLEPWKDARRPYLDALADLVQIADEDPVPETLPVAREIRRAGRSYLIGYSEPTVQELDRKAAVELVRAGEGKRRSDRIRELVDAVVRLDRAEASARNERAETADRAATITGLVGVGASLLAIVLVAGYIFRTLVRRVDRAAAASDAMASGDLSARLPVEGPEELRRLSASFNAMATSLQEREEELRRSEEAAREATAEAERANQAKSQFLSRMSHELRTPLNAVIGFGQLLELDGLEPKQRDSVKHILKGGRHLLDLINEVLDLSRIEAGELAVSDEPVPGAEVMRESVALIAPIADEHGITIHLDLDEHDARYVCADRQRLKQVLLNLLSNAVKYNRKGGEVHARLVRADDGSLRLVVSDTGHGIAPDAMDKIFSPFERLGAENSAVEGTGLGLALSKRLVEAMGGSLGVESERGRGSTFYVSLPEADPPADHDEPAAKVPAARAVRAGKVLYIEDNLPNLKLVEQAVARSAALTFIPAMHGKLGLDLARQHQPDLILLDVHLPDIPGDEVLRRLKADPATTDIPVVVLTADATRRQADRLLATGVIDYLTKPLDVNRLLEVVDGVLAPAV